MSDPIVERYQRILRADPASRVFIELARALLERGEAESAAEICARGVRHHPDSVVARIVWGKALLALGQHDDAIARFDEATQVDRASPYAYDLAGEALVASGFSARALPLLERGAEEHPRDPRILLWHQRALDLAARGSPEPTAAPRAAPTGASPPPIPAPSPLHLVRNETIPPPLRPPPVPAPEDDWSTLNRSLGLDDGPQAPLTPTETASAAPDTPAPSPTAESAPPTAEPSTPVTRLELAPVDAEEAKSAAHAEDGDAPATSPRRVVDLLPDVPAVTDEQATAAGAEAAGADAAPQADASEEPAREEPRAEAAEEPPRATVAKGAAGSTRKRLGVLALIALVLVASIGAATFFVVRNRQRAEDARSAAGLARAGLARDTIGSLREATRVLTDAQRVDPREPESAALLAEIAAVLAHDFGDGDARGAARAAIATNTSGAGTYAARWLVATDRERDEAAGSLLANRTATPLASTIAGQVLATLGDVDGARTTLNRAASASPPMLRAIALLGDLEMAAGAVAAARERYQAVVRVQPNHPRAAIGLAEASLATGEGTEEALKRLEAVAADRESTVPLQVRTRFHIALARLLATAGRATEALRVLDQLPAQQGARGDVVGTRATVLAATGDVNGALAAAETALKQSPGNARYRELIAQLQLRRGRFRDLLAGTEKDPTRTLRTYRGIARLGLGDTAGARQELEATRQDGKMTPEAAAWAALVEIESGRGAQVSGVVDRLLQQPTPHPVALLARARLDVLAGERSAAEQHLRAATERDPDLVEARVALGEVLLSNGRTAEALEVMKGAVARSPWRGIARVGLARALLASERRDEATQELRTVLANAPSDPPAEVAARRLLNGARRGAR